MRIPCQQCGRENELGRIFCVECGTKLDLSRASAGEIRAQVQEERYHNVWKLIPLALGLGIIVALALCLNPCPPAGMAAALGQAQGVRAGLEALHQASAAHRGAAGSFQEKDLNACFSEMAEAPGAASLSVSLNPDRIVFRMIQRLGPVEIGPYSLGPIRMSYDLVGTTSGGVLKIENAAMGHLRLIGPARSFVIRKAARELERSSQWQQLSQEVRGIHSGNGVVEIAVGN